jgi:hypothetical protein
MLGLQERDDVTDLRRATIITGIIIIIIIKEEKGRQ